MYEGNIGAIRANRVKPEQELKLTCARLSGILPTLPVYIISL